MTQKGKKPKFQRRLVWRYSKLGKHRRSMRVWRKPKGRDNKMREKLKGYPVVVSIGYKKDRTERKIQTVVNNVQDLVKVKKEDFVVMGKVGNRNKVQIAEKAKEMGIKIQNMNIKRFLKNSTKKGKSSGAKSK